MVANNRSSDAIIPMHRWSLSPMVQERTLVFGIGSARIFTVLWHKLKDLIISSIFSFGLDFWDWVQSLCSVLCWYLAIPFSLYLELIPQWVLWWPKVIRFAASTFIGWEQRNERSITRWASYFPLLKLQRPSLGWSRFYPHLMHKSNKYVSKMVYVGGERRGGHMG